MNSRQILTKTLVQSLEPNSNKEWVDAEEPSLRVIKTNSKVTFIARVFWKRQRYYERIGTFPAMNIAKARQVAAKLKLDVQLGKYEQVRIGPKFNKFIDGEYRSYVLSSIRTGQEYIDKINKVFLPYFGEKYLGRISESDIRRVLQSREQSVSTATVNRDLSAIASVFNFAVNSGVITKEQNPVANIKKQKESNQNKKRLPSKDKVKDIIRYCESAPIEHYLASRLILALLFTGCRRGELLSAKVDYIDFKESTITIPDTKSGHPYKIPLNERAMSILKELSKKTWSDYLFPSALAKGGPMSPPKRFLDKMKSELNLTEFSFHHCRAIFATMVAYENVFLAQQLLNHKDIKTTSRYLYADIESLTQVSQKIADSLTR
ncbi:tyrosine-type recombinase/integrase [Tenacibaculum sp.]|uniref:tyrosine-type recombinase/integrase n=1 Tax=Tenacibaculum sp. TaxID=1906242 RepID=UPI003AA94601